MTAARESGGVDGVINRVSVAENPKSPLSSVIKGNNLQDYSSMSKPSEPGAANIGGLAGVGMKVIHGNKYTTQQSQG